MEEIIKDLSPASPKGEEPDSINFTSWEKHDSLFLNKQTYISFGKQTSLSLNKQTYVSFGKPLLPFRGDGREVYNKGQGTIHRTPKSIQKKEFIYITVFPFLLSHCHQRSGTPCLSGFQEVAACILPTPYCHLTYTAAFFLRRDLFGDVPSPTIHHLCGTYNLSSYPCLIVH